MQRTGFKGIVKTMITRAARGEQSDIDYLMDYLKEDTSFAVTRFVDYALSLVENPTGIERLKHYLFEGSMIQRNYVSLYFNRKDGYEWMIVKDAYDKGLVDEIQMYAR